MKVLKDKGMTAFSDKSLEKPFDFEQLYYNYTNNKYTQLLLELQHHFISLCYFDPLSGEPIAEAMSQIVAYQIKTLPDLKQHHDKLTQLITHCNESLKHILAQPRKTIVREHEMVPVYKAQQIDSRSVEWLSRQTGRNLREKLAANPHILAVARRSSLNTLENRLLKELLIQLEVLLFDKQQFLGLTEDQQQLLDLSQQWFHQQEVQQIKNWQHTPPNNVLLEDRNYRKAWSSWKKLLTLNEEVDLQNKNTNISLNFYLLTLILTKLYANERVHLLEQEWLFDYQNLTLNFDNQSEIKVEGIYFSKLDKQQKLTLILQKEGDLLLKLDSSLGEQKSLKITLKDNNRIYLVDSHNKELRSSALDADNLNQFVHKLMYQWVDESYQVKTKPGKLTGQLISIELGSCQPLVLVDKDQKSQALAIQLLALESGLNCSFSTSLHVENNIVSGTHLAEESDGKSEAYGYLIENLAKFIECKGSLNYLINDYLSEFSTKTVRREFNRYFKFANPLPKSIAAVFDIQQYHRNNFKINDVVLTLDCNKEGVYVTAIVIAKGDNNNRVLERHPSVKLKGESTRLLMKKSFGNELPSEIVEQFVDLFSYNELAYSHRNLVLNHNGQWYKLPKDIKDNLKKQKTYLDTQEMHSVIKELKGSKSSTVWYLPLSSAIAKPKDIKNSDWIANPNVIRGSQYLLAQQQNNPRKIYWRDHLPQLFTRTAVAGREQNFYFVNDKTTITPIRGERIDVKIEKIFTLPSGATEISLPITQGKGKNKKRFNLQINSSVFPLLQEVECNLDLGYTYGEEQPYQLIFKPVNQQTAPFISLQAQWTEHDDSTPVESLFPDFPVIKSIDDLRSFDKKTDILEWADKNFQEIIDYGEFYINGESQKRIKLELTDILWRDGKHGKYGFVGDIMVREQDFDIFDQSLKFVSCEVIESNKRKSAKNITPLGELSKRDLELIGKISGRWRFPFITLFDQGRSLNDADFPIGLQDKAKLALNSAESLINGYQEKVEMHLYNELWQMVTYLHKDMPLSLTEKLIEFSTNKNDLRSKNLLMSYALGDLSCDWQQTLFTNILNPADDYGDTRSICLEIISTASWRHKDVILSLNLPQIEQLSKRLNLAFEGDIKKLKGNKQLFKWNSLLRRLELLLALMRCRASDNKEIKGLLAVGSPISGQFEQIIARVNESLGEELYNAMQRDNKIFSRVKLNLSKPQGYSKTVDILYALKLYLTGEDGANQITIKEVIAE